LGTNIHCGGWLPKTSDVNLPDKPPIGWLFRFYPLQSSLNLTGSTVKPGCQIG
jgi:hypothetical protein